MGKASRRKRQRDPQRETPDVAALLSAARHLDATRPKNADGEDPELIAAGRLRSIYRPWKRSDQTVFRCDGDLLDALVHTDRDVEVPDAALRALPRDHLAVSLTEPLVRRDATAGEDCAFYGFFAGGTRSHTMPGRPRLDPDGAIIHPVWTEHVAAAEADSLMVLWLFRWDGGAGAPGVQTMTVDLERLPATLASLIGEVGGHYWAAPAEGDGEADGASDVEVLLPAALSLLLYLASSEPDVDAPPPPSRPRGADGGEELPVPVRVGWQVGAALRATRDNPGDGGETSAVTGRRLPPHVRSAHWRRVRVAARDERGAIVGDRQGTQGVDWHYQLRWIPPTTVNVDADTPLAPTMRPVR